MAMRPKPKSGTATPDRVAFWDAAAQHTPLLAVDCDGLRFLVSTLDESVGATLFKRKQRNEMHVLATAIELLEHMGKRGAQTFVDVGANIGTTTIPALRHFERAVAIEPEPGNASLLNANFVLNGLADRVQIIEAAASNRSGEVILQVAPFKSGSHHLVHDLTAKKPTPHITVQAVTLDELADNGVFAATDIGLLWLDVQRHEGEVLDGARSLVAAGVPVVAEYNRDRLSPVFWDAVRDGYTHVWPLEAGGESIPITEAETGLRFGTMNLLLYRQ